MEEILKDGYKTYRFINEYETLNKMLDDIEEVNSLPESILNSFILNTIETVINDVLALNCMLDKSNAEFTNIATKMLKGTVDKDIVDKFQTSQRNLKVVNKLTSITENCLDKLLNICLYNDDIKYAVRDEIPELYENVYFLIDGEEELKEYIFGKIVDCYELKREDKIRLLNNSIKEFILDAENFIDLSNIKNEGILNAFYQEREKVKLRTEEKEE